MMVDPAVAVPDTLMSSSKPSRVQSSAPSDNAPKEPKVNLDESFCHEMIFMLAPQPKKNDDVDIVGIREKHAQELAAKRYLTAFSLLLTAIDN